MFINFIIKKERFILLKTVIFYKIQVNDAEIEHSPDKEQDQASNRQYL